MKKKESLWVSSHIFYDPDKLDFLLLNGVSPLVSSLKQKNLIKRFFFIRYRENGAHIRLRLKSRSYKGKKRIVNDQNLSFERFFNEYPSKRWEPKIVKEKKHFWYPNNTIHYFDYEQEVERYGGKYSIVIAEELFQYSSEIILNLLKNIEGDNYQKKLTYSLLLNLSFVIGLGYSVYEAMLFFQFVYEITIHLSFRTWNALELRELDYSEYIVNKEKTISIFEEKFTLIEKNISPKILEWWNYFNSTLGENKPLIHDWIKNVSSVHYKINQLFKDDKLDIPNRYYEHLKRIFGEKDFEQFNVAPWSIYESFIHMSNNRIGLRTRDEPYVNFLLYKVLNSQQ